MICVAEAEREFVARPARRAGQGQRDPQRHRRHGPAGGYLPDRCAASSWWRASPHKRPDWPCAPSRGAALPDCELVIAGEGPQLEAMRTLAAGLAPARIRLPGAEQDVPALLASAQAFVLASDHEGFPLSVLEAMRARLPVVATDLPGIREQPTAAGAACWCRRTTRKRWPRRCGAWPTTSACAWDRQARRAGAATSDSTRWPTRLGRLSAPSAAGLRPCAAQVPHDERKPPLPRKDHRPAATRSETVRRVSHMLSWALIGLLLYAVNAFVAEAAHHAGPGHLCLHPHPDLVDRTLPVRLRPAAARPAPAGHGRQQPDRRRRHAAVRRTAVRLRRLPHRILARRPAAGLPDHAGLDLERLPPLRQQLRPGVRLYRPQCPAAVGEILQVAGPDGAMPTGLAASSRSPRWKPPPAATA